MNHLVLSCNEARTVVKTVGILAGSTNTFVFLHRVFYFTAHFVLVNFSRIRQYSCVGTGAIANLQCL